MEVGESGGDLSESGLENRGVSVKVEWFGHILAIEALQPTSKPKVPRMSLIAWRCQAVLKLLGYGYRVGEVHLGHIRDV